MTRDEWRLYEKVQNKPDVNLAMRARCEEQGHDFENCCSAISAMFHIYQQCKWCGEKR